MSDHQTKKEFKYEYLGLLIIAISVFSFLGLVTTELYGQLFSSQAIGAVGSFLIRSLAGLFGNGKYIFPFYLGFIGFMVIRKSSYDIHKPLLLGMGLIYGIILSIFHLQFFKDSGQFLEVFLQAMEGRGGGLIGAATAVVLGVLFGPVGSYVILGTLTIIALLLITNISLKDMISRFKKYSGKAFELLKTKFSDFLFYEIEEENEEIPVSEDEQEPIPIIVDQSDDSIFVDMDTEDGEKDQGPLDYQERDMDDAHDDYESYNLPPMDILKRPIRLKKSRINKDLAENIRLLEQTLTSFGVQAKVSQVGCGPAITRYELQPAKGVKVNRIVSLSDDIALSLAAPDIRIVAPIPGKPAVGIEVPNKEVTSVYLREVLDSKEFKKVKSPLIAALGKGISGNTVIANLQNMPHLLIAGATGSGKSVCMNVLIAGLLFKNRPRDLKLMIIDPKRVEMANYNEIPHLLAPVVTEPKKAAVALKWAVKEMETRYELFANRGVRDIDGYNEAISKDSDLEKLPYIVILIDELADLMMVSPSDVEDSICRLAQMARASGIHLVIATQRPSVDVITGLIKANIPSRIAFAVSSQTDSRTILDMGGAEKLLGNGDMLFHPVGASKPMRIQGAYISDKEVDAIVEFHKEQGNPQYEKELVDIQQLSIEEKTEVVDELLPDAVKLCIEQGHASISLLQRRLRIGYTRAARLMDIMDDKGYVGPYEGSKPREILIDFEQYQEYF